MVFRPLAGCGLFPGDDGRGAGGLGFRPLAGCGLFLFETDTMKAAKAVSVPLRGVGCKRKERRSRNGSFRPLAGCGLFHTMRKENNLSYWFPSPCGVWVVSSVTSNGWEVIRRFSPLAGCGFFLVEEAE